MVKIKWTAHMRGNTGYAVATRAYCTALRDIGVDLICDSFDNVFPQSHAWMAETATKDDTGYFHICHEIPEHRARAHYTVYEMDQAPVKWGPLLNRDDFVMTPSEYSKKSLSSICPPEKIHVVHHGIDPRFSPDGDKVEFEVLLGEEVPDGKPQKADGEDFLVQMTKSKPLPKFKFLSVFEWVDRKYGARLIKAFVEEFDKNDDACLVLKTYSNLEPITHEIAKLAGDANVFLLKGYVDDMSTLYRAADAYISCSSGEGWGETLSEAMACGLPTIGSNNGGNVEFMNQENSFLVPVEDWQMIGHNILEPLIEPWFMHRPPRIDGMKAAMRSVFNGGRDVTSRVREAVKIRDAFTWEKAAGEIARLVEKHEK
jgi:glycosyltransferase involved in cell wall biosynthesis